MTPKVDLLRLLERALDIRSQNRHWTKEETARSWNAWEAEARAALRSEPAGTVNPSPVVREIHDEAERWQKSGSVRELRQTLRNIIDLAKGREMGTGE